MNEFEDVILPDDFEMDTPQSEEVTEPETVEPEVTEETIEPTEPTEEIQQTPQTLKVKFNKEEKEIPLDEAIPLVQKGLNYDKQLERLQALESDPRLSFVEELAREQGMEVNEYLDAVKQHREQARLDALIQENIPPELAQEILEGRKDREARKKQEEEKAKEEQKNAEYNEFFQFYRQVNRKDFVPGTDEIPAEVWEANQNGTPLKYAFMEHQMQQLQSQVKVLKQNKTNEQRAPINGVSAHGGQEVASVDPFEMGFDSIK